MSLGIFIQARGIAADLRSMRQEAENSRKAALYKEDRVRALEVEFDKLLLAAQAMWELQKRKLGLTDADLTSMITELDLQDGKRDGKRARKANTVSICAGCSRPLNRKHTACIYCGSTALSKAPFDTIGT